MILKEKYLIPGFICAILCGKALAEKEQTIDNNSLLEKENQIEKSIGKGIDKESEWKINSDTAEFDYAKNKMINTGKAVFKAASIEQDLTIQGDIITSQIPSSGASEYVEVQGIPAHLVQINKTVDNNSQIELWAEKINYHAKNKNQKNITALNKVKFIQKSELKGDWEIIGDEFIITQSTNYHLKAKGSPLSFSITKPNEIPVKAEAGELIFDESKQIIELRNSVILTRQQTTMAADKLFYDVKTGNLRIPKTSNKQLELIQKTNNQP